MSVVRRVQVDSDDFDDLDKALVWVIKYHDREFEDCPAFTIQVEKNQRCVNNDGQWETFFSATITGIYENDEDSDDLNSAAITPIEKD